MGIGSYQTLPYRAALAHLGTCEMKIFRPMHRLTESETLEVEPRNLFFNKPPRDSDAHKHLRSTAVEV